MAINQNHTFEELNGIKCGIVEKNVKPERVEFLKNLLEYNQFTVVVVTTPPPKIAPLPPAAKVATTNVAPSTTTETQSETQQQIPTEPAPVKEDSNPAPSTEPTQLIQPPPLPSTPPPETFTVGVTDVTFNAINAIFGRLLHTKDGHVVTLAYWQQKENVAHDEIPYFDNKS